MSPLRDNDRRELLIVDTGPIRELILHHAVFHFRFQKLRSHLQWLKTQASYDRCSGFIAAFRQKMTSASVVAELDRWIRETEKLGQAKLWNRVYDEFRNMQMQEEAVSLVEMKVDMVARFGPVDASLIGLAKRHQNLQPIVLTVDKKLCDECRGLGFDVRLLEEV